MKHEFILSSFLIFPGLAFSQPDKAPAALEEMVVTASAANDAETRKDDETKIAAEILEARSISEVKEIFTLIPNASAIPADGNRAVSFAVRGSAEMTFHEFTGGRSGVAYYVDDIPFTDAYGRDLAMLGAEEISFFKGPHGSAFGAPGALGVIDAKTKKPAEKWSGSFSQSYASYDSWRSVAGAGGQIAPGFSIQIDGLFDQSDGWFTDRLTGDDYGKSETEVARMRLLWEATERLSFTWTSGVQRHDDDPGIYVPLAVSDPYKLSADPNAFATGSQQYHALKAEWEGDDWLLKSISSFRRSDFDDSDQSLLLDIFNPVSLQREREQDVTAWTQEIRIESTDPGAAWNWRTGVFFSDRDSHLDHHILGLGPWEGWNDIRYHQQDLALYGELSRKVGEKLEITAGLRLQSTWDHTSSDFTPTDFAQSLGGAAASSDGKDRFVGLLPTLSAVWKWSNTQRTHIRFAEGMQPGGLAIAAAGSDDYASEHSFHYELGHESAYFSDKLKIQNTIFYTDYEDYQSFQFNPAGQTIYNASRAHAWGVESGVSVKPLDHLELSSSVGWTLAEYDDFDVSSGDYSGKRIDNIPRATANAAAAYHADWGGVARLDWRYQGKTMFDQGNQTSQSGYSVFDLRVGYEKSNYGVFLFCKNLLDESKRSAGHLFDTIYFAATDG
ncbi:MAG: TonB-dependent receptor, partial [Luteolibacter sp.]